MDDQDIGKLLIGTIILILFIFTTVVYVMPAFHRTDNIFSHRIFIPK